MADHKFIIKGDAPAVPDLVFWNLIRHDGLARPSVYELTVLSKRQTIDAKEILGQTADAGFRFRCRASSGVVDTRASMRRDDSGDKARRAHPTATPLIANCRL